MHSLFAAFMYPINSSYFCSNVTASVFEASFPPMHNIMFAKDLRSKTAISSQICLIMAPLVELILTPFFKPRALISLNNESPTTISRVGFPLPPLPRTMLLYPLEEDVDKYKKKNTELLKVMNEYKDNVDMTFEEFLEKFAKMDFDDYIKRVVPESHILFK